MPSPEKPSKRKKTKSPTAPAALPILQPLVAGIDVGSTQHWVCGPPRDGKPNVRVFATTTTDLNALADWLVEQGVKSVAMESTYIYWIPIFSSSSRAASTWSSSTRGRSTTCQGARPTSATASGSSSCIAVACFADRLGQAMRSLVCERSIVR